MRYCATCDLVSTEGNYCSTCGSPTAEFQRPPTVPNLTIPRPARSVAARVCAAIGIALALLPLITIQGTWVRIYVGATSPIEISGWDYSTHRNIILVGVLAALIVSVLVMCLPRVWPIGFAYLVPALLIASPGLKLQGRQDSANASAKGLLDGLSILANLDLDVHSSTSALMWATVVLGSCLVLVGAGVVSTKFVFPDQRVGTPPHQAGTS